MNQELEIEFKNMLSKKEYDKLLKYEFSVTFKRKTIQSNHYFDTMGQVLKNQNSALRIRVTDSYNELTLKVPSQGFLMETNISLSDDEASEIIDSKNVTLSSILSMEDSFPKLEHVTEDTVFYLFNAFETKRLEKQVGEHLLVLDQTTFQNGTVDYELEVESTDAEIGKEFFESFLEKYSIPMRPALPKIARAQQT